MENIDIIKKIFKEPGQYGLRGDPYLWRAFKLKFEDHSIATVEAFRNFLIEVFIEHTGCEPTEGKNFFVSQFDCGGMSSGTVSSDFWLEKGFPLLENRFKALFE
jgi:hypothetical protein